MIHIKSKLTITSKRLKIEKNHVNKIAKKMFQLNARTKSQQKYKYQVVVS